MWIGVAARALARLPSRVRFAVAQERLLVRLERRVDRIERHQRGQQRRFAGAGRHEVAFGDDGAADAAVDRRGDARELEIELGGAQARFHRGDLRRRFGGERGAALLLLVRHRVLGREALGALQLGGGAADGGARPHQLGAQAIDFRLERPRVDLEEQVAALDDRAFAEADRRHVARHARPDRHGVDRFEPARELVPFGDLTRQHFRRGHLRRRRIGRLRRRARAGLEEDDRK